MNTIITSDISELAAAGSVMIPDQLEDVRLALDSVSGLMLTGQWGTAAMVGAYVEPGERGDNRYTTDDEKSSSQLTIAEFAALKIRGLSTRDSVRKYHHAWEHAIKQEWAEPARPGERVTLPSQPFKLSGAHVGRNSGENEWYTPPEIVEAARATMGEIDLDPASTADANTVVQAKTFYTQEDDGLLQEWAGRVWLNPPNGLRLVRPFTEKLVESYRSGAVEQACVLVNNATDKAWWQHLAAHVSALCLPAGRIELWHPDRDACSPPQGHAILYLGDRQHDFCKEFSTFGETWSRTNSAMATRAGGHSQVEESDRADLPSSGGGVNRVCPEVGP